MIDQLPDDLFWLLCQYIIKNNDEGLRALSKTSFKLKHKLFRLGIFWRVPMFIKQKTFDLGYSGRHFYFLDMTACVNIWNVSALGNTYKLWVRYCPAVSDVSNLRDVHTLSLKYCCGIKDFSNLGRVHTLNLMACNVSDLSFLSKVYDLDLSRYKHQINDLKDLKDIHTLNLTDCDLRCDINILENVHTLNISGCFVKDTSFLKNVHTLIK